MMAAPLKKAEAEDESIKYWKAYIDTHLPFASLATCSKSYRTLLWPLSEL